MIEFLSNFLIKYWFVFFIIFLACIIAAVICRKKIKELLIKYRELVVYIIVGVITTIVNWGVSFLLDATVLDSSVPLQNTVINVIAWIAAVVVSFPMNRKWVFQSHNPAWFHEFLGFTASRVTTLLIEELVMLLCVNLLGIDFRISKVFIASVLVIILNYVFSKLFVFRKGQKQSSPHEDNAQS